MRGTKQTLKRILAMLLSVSLLTGQVGTTSFAAEYMPGQEMSAHLSDEVSDAANEYAADAANEYASGSANEYASGTADEYASGPDETGSGDTDPEDGDDSADDPSPFIEDFGEGTSSSSTAAFGEDAYEAVIEDPDADADAFGTEESGGDVIAFDADVSGGDAEVSDLTDIIVEDESGMPEDFEELESGTTSDLSDGFDDMAVDEALEAGQAQGGTWALLKAVLRESEHIVLQKDYAAAEGDGALVIPEDKSVTLNLNGHTISSGTTDYLFDVCGTLTLQGPGTLSLQNGNYTVYVRDGGCVDMQDCIITSDQCRGSVLLDTTKENACQSTFSMNGGTITGTHFKTEDGHPACTVYDAGIFTLKEGTVSGSGMSIGVADNSTLRLNPQKMNGIQLGSIFLDRAGGNGPVVQIDSSLNDLPPIGVSAANLPEAGDALVFTRGLSGRGSAKNFISADPAWAVRAGEGGEAQLMMLHAVLTETDTGDGTVTADARKACAGDMVTLTITPDEGYDLVKLTVDGEEVEAAAADAGSYGFTFTMPGKDIAVRASFDTHWAVLKNRFAAGGTVTLNQDYIAKSGDAVLEVYSGKELILDLNGHTITGYRGMDSLLKVSGNLTLKDEEKNQEENGGENGEGSGEENREESGKLCVSGAGGYNTVDVQPGGSFIMEGGSIEGAGGRRCAVLVEDNARFFMYGGSITGDSLKTVVRVVGFGDQTGSFSMSGGRISGTSPLETDVDDYVGDIVANQGNFTMTGGSITGGKRGLGVDADWVDSSLTIYGSPSIEKVFLYEGARIRIGGKLTLKQSQPIAVEASPMPSYGSPRVFTRSLKNNADAKLFASANENYAVRTNASGEAQLTLLHGIAISSDIANGTVQLPDPDSAKACEGDPVKVSVKANTGFILSSLSFSTDSGETQTAFTPEDGFTMPDADVTIYAQFDDGWNMLRSLMAKGGEITLTKSYTAAAGDLPLEIPAGVSVTLDLKGFNIDRGLAESEPQDDGCVIINNGTLTIKNTTGSLVGGSIKGGNNTGDGGGIVNNGVLTLLKGQITGNKAGGSGGGIYNSATGSLTMTGGNIYNNTARLWHGGGICNNGTLTLSGGRIESNKALGEGGSAQGGGIWQNGTMNVSGDPRVVNNTAGQGNAPGQGNNIYLRAEHPTMNVVGSFTSGTNGASLYVSSARGTGVITSGYGTHNVATDPGDIFTAEGNGYVIYKADGEAKIQKGSAIRNYVERSWDAEKKEVVCEVKDTDAADPVPDNGAMTSGWYYLNKDISVNSRVCLTGDTDLILGNGKTLNVKGLYVPAGSTLNIYAESVNGTGQLISKPDKGAGIGAYSGHKGGSIVIHGGRIEAKGGGNCAGIGSNDGNKTTAPITIYGGGVIAQGGENGAGIGGGRECDGGTITIYDGSVYARGGSDAAGIGGGEDAEGGVITIWGGIITANEDPNENAAAIGGGEDDDGGTITINGGTIHTWSRDGAGIGGGEDGDGGTITINGGTITCEDEGSAQGARIGGGNDGDGGRITINGGSVKVFFRDGAGIGGGEDGDSGTILITGGDVTSEYADGSQGNGAAIGGGNHDGNGEIIKITGGVVHARSNGGAGIGGGRANDRKTTSDSDQNSGDGGTIDITGGTVYASSELGFGIGAGGPMGKETGSNPGEEYLGSAGHITIGGSAYVNTWGALAGIGGDDGYVRITGGTVNTYGSDRKDCGRGILMKDRDGHGNVYISGGKVTARGVGEWPAISAEREGTVRITGGRVEAYAPEAAAIGSRCDSDSHHRMTGSIRIEGRDTYVKAESGKGVPIGDHWNYENDISFGPGITLELITGYDTHTGLKRWFCKNSFYYAGARYTAGADKAGAKTLPAAERNKAHLNEKHLYGYLRVEPCTHAGTMQGGTCTACGYRQDSRKYIERHWDGEKVVSEEKDSPASTADFPVKEDDLTGGWYYVGQSATIKHRVCFSGDTNLILKDGVVLETRGLYVPEGCTLTIYGETEDCRGKIISRPSGGGAGIGGYAKHPGGNIVIHGGYIEAVGDDHCAGIGSNDDEGAAGSFTMYGGNVTAVGGSNGAGIGGGRESDAGKITIYAGTVTAIGKNDAAAIGGGDSDNSKRGNASEIRIYGGEITATAAASGASIGGGDYGTANVYIYGGTVETFHTGGPGVGIGGGSKKTPDESTITLGYNDQTKETIRIQAAALGGSVTLEQPFQNGEGEHFTPGKVPENQKAQMARSVLTAWDFEVLNWELLQYALNHTKEGSRIVLIRDIKAGPEDTQFTVPKGATVILDLNGFTIDRGVTADYGINKGRVMVNRGALTIQDSAGGGMITGGRARFDVGGGGILNYGTLELKGGTVTGNWAYGSGGGIYNAEDGVFIMSGGRVSENISFSGDGGGICSKGTLDLSGGKITGNEAQQFGLSQPCGGGIYNDGTLNLSGDPVVNDNAAPYAGNNIYFAGVTKAVITDELTNSEPIGVFNDSGTFTEGLSGKGTAENFISDREGYAVGTDAEGEAYLGQPVTVTFASGDPEAAGEMNAVRLAKDSGFTLPACKYTVEDRPFLIWSVQIGAGDAARMAPGEHFTVSADTTVTAVWKKHMAVEAEGADVVYDAAAHGIRVEVTDPAEGYTVTYGLEEGIYDLDESPTAVEVSESPLIVYYQVTAPGYIDVTGSAEVTIRQRTAYVMAVPQTVPLHGSINTGLDAVLLGGQVVSGHVLKGITLSSDISTEHVGTEGWITPAGAVIRNAQDENVTSNYEITYVPGKLTVEKGEAVVTAPKARTGLTYNGKEQKLVTGGSSNGGALEYSTDGENWSMSVPVAVNAGEYLVFYRAVETDDYFGSDPMGPVAARIGRAPLTVTAEDQTITYGETPADGSVTYAGFVNGETKAALSGALSFTCDYRQHDNVGTYAIEPEGLTSGNYEITFKPGTLEVLPKKVGLEWGKTEFRYNGGEQGPTATATGLVNGDVISVTVNGTGKDAGDAYAATAAGLNGEKACNYMLPEEKTTVFSIRKDSWPEAVIYLDVLYNAAEVTASMAGRMPGDAGTLVYSALEAKSSGNVAVTGFSVDTEGNVTAALSGGAAGDSVDLPVGITSTNYKDTVLHLMVLLTGKDKTDVIVTDGGNSVTQIEKTYGDGSFTLNVSAVDPGTNGEWAWTSSNPKVALVGGSMDTAEVHIEGCGTTTITAHYSCDETVGQGEVTLTVVPKDIAGAKVSVSGRYIYNGTPQKPAEGDVTVILEGETLKGGLDYILSSAGRTDAGEAALTVTGRGNYTGTVSGSFAIAPAPLSVTTGSAKKDYDGKALTNTNNNIAGLVNGETISVNITGSQTEVGSSQNTCSISWDKTAKKTNYDLTLTCGTLTVTTNDALITLTAASDSKIYDGKPLTNAAVAVTGFPEGFTVEATAQGSATNVGDAGKNTVSDGFVIKNAAGEDRNESFKNVEKVDGTLTIRPRSILGAKVTLNTAELPFDGGEKFAAVTKVELDDELLDPASDYDLTDGTTGRDVGIYTVTVSGKGNFTGNAAAVWRIIPGSMEVTASDANVEYDGAAHGIHVGANIPKEDYTVMYGTVEGTYDMTESPRIVNAADSPQTVYYKVTASGYRNVTGSATVTIHPRPAVVTALPQSVTLNGSIDTGLSAALLSGQVSGHALSSVSIMGSSTKHAGTEGTITPGNAVIADSSGKDVTANYDITYVNGALTVGKGSIVVTAPEARAGLTYNGAEQELVKGGRSTGGALEYSADGKNWSATVPTAKNAGEYSVYFRAVETDDYYGSEPMGPVVVQIGRASLKVAVKDQSITYGEAPADGSVTYTGFVNGETEEALHGALSFTCAYRQYDNVGTYVIEPEGLMSDNYEITFRPGVLSVLPRTVGLNWDKTEFTYNGGEQGPSATATGLVNGDAIAVTVDGVGQNAGNYVATACALSGEKAGNYALSSADKKTFSIKKAAWPEAFIDLDLPYSATAVTASMAGRMPEDAGTVVYSAGETQSIGNVVVTYFTVDPAGSVTAALSGGAAGNSVDLPVRITSMNYEDTVLHLTVWLTHKGNTDVTIAGEDAAQGQLTRTYGDDSFTLSASAADPGHNGGWEWSSSNTKVALVGGSMETALVRIEGCGTTTITARYSCDEAVGQGEVTLTVVPKSIAPAKVSMGGSYDYNGTLQKPADSDVTVILDGEKLTGGLDYHVDTAGRKDAGEAVLTVTGSGNYTGTVSGSFAIVPAPLSVTTGSAQKAYDGKALTNTHYNISGLVNGETVTVNVTGSRTEIGSSKNSCEILWNKTAKEGNYKLTLSAGTLEVTENTKQITLTAASDSKIYDGTPLKNAAVAATGLPEGFTVEATAWGSAANVGDAGVNTVNDGFVIKNAAGEDKTVCFTNVKKVDGSLTIRPRSISGAKVTLSGDELRYNGNDQSVQVTKVVVDDIRLAESDFDVKGETHGRDVGIYTVTVTGKGNCTGTATAVWRIIPGSLKVTAPDTDVEYNGATHGIRVEVAEPAEGYTIRYGLEEGKYDLNESPSAENVSDSPLTVYYKVTAPGYGDKTGYATVTIHTRPAAVTALPQSTVLNGSIDTGVGAASLSGQVGGHELAAIRFIDSGTEHAGTEGTIKPCDARIEDGNSNDVTTNYDITYVNGTLTVGKGSIVVTAPEARAGLIYNGAEQELVKGGRSTGGALEYSVDGENWSASVPKAKNAGEYTVYFRAAETDDHYGSETMGPVVVRIGQASLQVAVKDQTITYGEVSADYVVIYTGFVNGETEKNLEGVLSCSCAYERFGNAGTYAIEPRGLTSGNYEVTFKPGVLSVLPKTVGLNWSKTEFRFNGGEQGPAATATGLVNGDVIAVTVDGAMKDAGDDYVAAATALTGDKAGNYALPKDNTTAFSIRKDFWPEAIINMDLPYDAVTVTTSMAGRMPEDAGTVVYSAGEVKSSGNVEVSVFAVYTTGNVTAALSGGEAGDSVDLPVRITSTNYEDTVLHLMVWLTDKSKSDVTISGEGLVNGRLTKTYGDDPFRLKAIADIPGKNAKWEWSSSNPKAAVVSGSLEIAEVKIEGCGTTTLTVRYSSDDTIGQGEMTLTVLPKSMKAAKVSVSGEYTYNGSEQRPAEERVTVTLDGKFLKGGLDYTMEASDNKDAGEAALTITGCGNYTGTVSGSYTIAPAPLSVTTGSAQRAYDGKTLTNTYNNIAGLVNGEMITVNVTGSQTEVGSSKNTCGISWDGTAKESNYALTLIPGTLEVTKNAAQITLTAASDSKIYDGTALTNAAVAVTGLPEGFIVEAAAEGSAANVGDAGRNTVRDGFVIKNAAGEDRTAGFINVKKVDGTLTIRPRSISDAKVTLDTAELSFDGGEKKVAVTKVELDNEVLDPDSDYDVTDGTSGRDAGIYTATVTGKGNYTGTAVAAWRIVLVPITAAAENVTVTYDGKPHGITVEVDPSVSGAIVRYGMTWGSYDLEESPTLTDAGKLTVYWQVSADNYQSAAGSAAVTVERAEISPSVIMEDQTYGKFAAPVVNGNTGNGKVTCLYSDEEDGTYSEKEPSKVGNWWVKAVVDANNNCSAAATAPVSFKVLPAQISITADNISSPYGEGIMDLTWQVGGDYVEGDDLGISAVSAAEEGSLSGTYPITISWNENPNYTAVVKDGTYTVERRKVTVTALPQSVLQGGGIRTGIAQAKLTGQVSGHVLRQVTLTAGSTAQPATAGSITPSGAVIMDAAGNDVTMNYDITYQTGRLTVISGASKKPEETKAQAPAGPALGADGTAFGKGADAAALDAAIAAMSSDADPKGTRFAPLCLKASKVTKSSIKVTWKKVGGAREYVVYANACGKNNRLMKVKTTTARSFTLKKLGGKKLKKGKYYKFMVAALDDNGKVITVSSIVHAATEGGKVGNPGNVQTQAGSGQVNLKKGKKYKLAGKAVSAVGSKKVKKHRAVRYETSDPAVAVVTSKGVIKAKKKGTCYIYAFAQNGVYARIKITVK